MGESSDTVRSNSLLVYLTLILENEPKVQKDVLFPHKNLGFAEALLILIFITINFCGFVANSGSRADYDDKYLYSRSYSGSRADYDDKYLYSRR